MKKYLSRKFLMAVVSTILSIGMCFEINNNTLQIIIYVGVIIINTIYIITEGKIDGTSLKNALGEISTLLNQLYEKNKKDN